MTIAAHRIDGVDELVSECLSRTEDLRPWIVAGAADIATFAAIYRFASGGARRMQDSAAPHYERITDRTTRWTDTASPASRRTSNSTSPRPRTVSGGPSASPGARVAPFAGDPAGQRAARRPAVRPERDRREQQRQGRPRAAPGTAPAGRLPVVSGPRPGGRVLAPAAATCARLGLIRLLLDGGPQVVPILEAVQGKLDGGRWRPEWPPIPSTFLADALDAARPP